MKKFNSDYFIIFLLISVALYILSYAVLRRKDQLILRLSGHDSSDSVELFFLGNDKQVFFYYPLAFLEYNLGISEAVRE